MDKQKKLEPNIPDSACPRCLTLCPITRRERGNPDTGLPSNLLYIYI